MNRKVSVAPMMDCTDKHERYFLRLISKNVLLYTEMIVSEAIDKGDRQKLLLFNFVLLTKTPSGSLDSSSKTQAVLDKASIPIGEILLKVLILCSDIYCYPKKSAEDNIICLHSR